MLEFSLGYRKVVPDQTLPEKWKEITLKTGGSQSTLQDINVPERAGGYSYKDCSKYFTRNRFIYWRICHDVLELVEHSLDVNLANCRVRYKFTDTPILDGISIHETVNSVVILVVTVSSVHKLTFPHPDKLHKTEHLLGSHPDLSVQSILGETSVQTAQDPHTFHVIASAGTTRSTRTHAEKSSRFRQRALSRILLEVRLGMRIQYSQAGARRRSIQIRENVYAVRSRPTSRRLRLHTYAALGRLENDRHGHGGGDSRAASS